MMDFHRCIGCRFCMAACPFGARSFNYRDPRPALKQTNKQFPTRMKGVVEKCSFCVERLAEGKMPACVEASEGKLAFGDLFDEKSRCGSSSKPLHHSAQSQPGDRAGCLLHRVR
jgi:molybdopterin-containing oxidoreductase family iron-sulfur binding subunit